MYWSIPILVLLALVVWILASPLRVRVRSDERTLSVSLPGLAGVTLRPGGSLVLLRIRVFFVRFTLDPLASRRRKKKEKSTKPEKKTKDKRKTGRSPAQQAGLVRALLRAVRIRHLYLDLDTGDFSLNAMLYPALALVRTPRIQTAINFEGRLFLDADFQTRLGTLLFIAITHRIKHKPSNKNTSSWNTMQPIFWTRSQNK
ncbi:MAG: hypothetical protein R2751_01170 [Bacteroidales bacterium]